MTSKIINPECDALFLSDTHGFHLLNGAIHRQAKILHHMRPESIHLVGDIIDFEAIVHILKSEFSLKKNQFPQDFSKVYNLFIKKWPYFEIHLRFLDLVFKHIQQDVNVFYEPGNHDENLDQFDNQELLGLKIQKHAQYDIGNNQFIRIEHGHRFDPGWLQRNTDWYKRGSRILNIALQTDIILNKSLKRLYYKQKSARNFIKEILQLGENHANDVIEKTDPNLNAICENFYVANGVKALGKSYVRSFEDRAVKKAHHYGAAGILCGHIHKVRRETKDVFTPDDELYDASCDDSTNTMTHGSVLYLNAGDGLTKGAAMLHRKEQSKSLEKQFDIILGKKLELPWCITEQNTDEKLRAKTMEFMQYGWTASLKMLNEAPRPK
jgi:UDP-2,3-diacylglucosamine pyrophosphatase LpxH